MPGMFETLVILAMMSAGAEPQQANSAPICQANGQVFEQGETACLDIPCAPQLARCGMVLNNSAWIKIQDGCLVSGTLKPPPPPPARKS